MGYGSAGRLLPDDFDGPMQRAEKAAGCPPRRKRAPAELVEDEQFPPLSALDSLQATVWLENRYGFKPDAFVFEEQLPSYTDPPRETNFEPLRTSDLMRLRPRQMLRPGEPESAIWVNSELINFYVALLRRLVLSRYGDDANMFLFPMDVYDIIRGALRSGSPMRHRDTVAIRAKMLAVGSRILFPIHDSGNHWIVCTVTVTGPGAGEFRNYDSLATAYTEEYRNNVRRWLSEEYSLLLGKEGTPFSLAIRDVAYGDEASYLRQENCYDCGVFAMFVARGLVLRHVYHGQARLVPALPDFQPRNVALRSDYMRRVLTVEMVNHRIPFSDWKE